uniref:E3 ubiquitin-protein ligase TRIM7-like isoform X1 n=2 Tax=Podarcis muralis TaxID=64176 RepID=UPI00109F4BBA|nr:E3 ubiquitin-protein ligase TRIM7-like isoform X1 [Podarcis muralis]
MYQDKVILDLGSEKLYCSQLWDQISSCLDNMRKERKKILVFKADAEKESQDLLKQMQAEREKMVAEFRRLRQFLEEKEKLLLAQMAEVEKEIAKKREEHLARLSRELSSLDSLIREMEEKLQEPASELLQDIRSFLQRSQAKENLEAPPVAFPLVLKWKIWDFCDINPFLEGVMKKLRDTVEYGLKLRKENVTLDPDTANPRLILSEDRKSVRWGEVYQDLPDNPERFDMHGYVLGCEGFTSGRHFWEVTVGREERRKWMVALKPMKRKGLFSLGPSCVKELTDIPERFDRHFYVLGSEAFREDRCFWDVFVGSKGEWAVGVARESVKRKGKFIVGPKEGIWRIGKWGDQYRVSTYDGPPVLMVGGKPKRIRVALNCEGGRVSFYDADTAALLHSFSAASFSGETLQPFFYMFTKGHLTVS